MVSFLLSVFLLGLVHGLTPDEHTWPVISSYAIGQRRAKRGALAAFLFSIFEIIPWIAIASACAFLGSMIYKEAYEVWVHLILGLIMLAAGAYMLWRKQAFHLHIKGCPERPSMKIMPVYGLVSGFGPCLPVLALYTFAAQTQHRGYGIILALLFGLGTMLSLIVIASILAKFVELAEKKWKETISRICSWISGGILVIFGIYLLITSLI